MGVDNQKLAAAEHAAELVEAGMVVGLGSGSTAEIAVQALGRRVRKGLEIVGVATSERTALLAREAGIRLTTLEDHSQLDLAIDGADEFDRLLNLVKGRGGALLREKIVASSSERFVVVVDESKRVTHLGEKAPIPIEIIPFGWTTTQRRLERLGLRCTLRSNGVAYLTSNHNYILDCHAAEGTDLADPALALRIKEQTGVVEHGLFIHMTSAVVVGTGSGQVEVLDAPAVLG